LAKFREEASNIEADGLLGAAANALRNDPPEHDLEQETDAHAPRALLLPLRTAGNC